MASFRPRSLTDFGAILWRRKWLFILIAAAMLQATYLVARTVPDLYEGRAQIAVVVKPGDDTGSLSTQITALQHRTLSRELLAPLISKLGLIKPGEDMDAAATRLRNTIKLDVKLRSFFPEFPETITITYRHSDPKIAQAVVSHILSHFTNTNKALGEQAAVQVREVEQELSSLVGSLSKLTNERNAATKNPAIAAIEDPRLLRRQLLSEINVLSDKQFMLERQLELQNKQIAEQKLVAQTTPTATGPTATTSYGFMLAEKARLQAVLKDYERQYTKENPKLKQAQLQLNEVEQTLTRLEKTGEGGAAKLNGPEAQVLRSLEREAEKQLTELDLTKRNLEAKRLELSRLPAEVPASIANANQGAEAQATSTAEYERLSKRYFWLLDRKDALAKAQADLNEGPNITLFRLIDSAYVPDIPVAPNKMLLRLLCLGMSLGTAILVVAFAEARNFFRIEDERDVEYFLGAPVVGLIPETLTPVENSRIRRQKLARVGLVVGIVIVMIPTVMLVLQRVGIFNVIGSK